MSAGTLLMGASAMLQASCTDNDYEKDGSKYVPYDQRTGDESIVYSPVTSAPMDLSRLMRR
jgi:hypothetical protein